jgi:hypothetical protein
LVTVGPRCGVIGLVSAALEPDAVQAVECHDSLGSLKEVIERNWAVSEKPELFCFGLLESFDLKQLTALVAPRPVRFHDPSKRLRQEMEGVREWYERVGGSCDPLSVTESSPVR